VHDERDSVQTYPTDRSISPQTISSTRPMPMIHVGAHVLGDVDEAAWLKKSRYRTPRVDDRITAITVMWPRADSGRWR